MNGNDCAYIIHVGVMEVHINHYGTGHLFLPVQFSFAIKWKAVSFLETWKQMHM